MTNNSYVIVPEPDMMHPKIQRLIAAKARREMELQLVEQLLDEGPDCELTAMSMEYWYSLHDKLKDALNLYTVEERERCAQKAAPEHITFSDYEWQIRCEIRDSILNS